MAKDLPWKQAIITVLSASDGPMHYKDIAEKIVSEELRTKSIGATPAATVSVTLSNSINNEGDSSPFIKVGRGEYYLREPKVSKKRKAAAKKIDDADEPSNEAQYDVISSFGMFWRRDLIDWKTQPSLLGMQQLGAEPVDFRDQVGIYLLYDGREIIYVGRAVERPLARRLYEHTVDRLSTRWDRFSWFGLLPVSDKGKLGQVPATYSSQKLMPALEAIMIEALEPRQNRKRGDDLSAVEYLQKADPEIERKKRKAVLEAAMKDV